MANTKTAKKELRKSRRRTAVNKNRKSQIRTAVRKTEQAIAAGDKDAAKVAFKTLEPVIMHGATKKVLKLNTAARKLRRLSTKIKKIGIKKDIATKS